MRMTTFGTLSIDEVHPLIDSTFGREPEYENRSAMYLKTCTAVVSSEAVPNEEFLPVRRRPARTPPSTFLFLPIHFSNSPGTMAVPTLR